MSAYYQSNYNIDERMLMQMSPSQKEHMCAEIKMRISENIADKVAEDAAKSMTFQTYINSNSFSSTITGSSEISPYITERMHYAKNKLELLSEPRQIGSYKKPKLDWKAKLRKEVADWIEIKT